MQVRAKAPTLEQKLPVTVLLVVSLGDVLDTEALAESDHPDYLFGADREIVVRVYLAEHGKQAKKGGGT